MQRPARPGSEPGRRWCLGERSCVTSSDGVVDFHCHTSRSDGALPPGRPAYVPRVGLGPKAAIEVIRAAGGVPVLAHFPLAPDRPEIIDELCGWGLVGLEVHYAKFDESTIARMAAFAAARRLLPTGGTDYHGDKGPYPEARAALRVPSEVGNRLRDAVAMAQAARV